MSLYLIGEGESVENDDPQEIYNRETLRYIEIKFSKPTKYNVGHCLINFDRMIEFDEPPPSTREKLWTITKRETQLLIQCNGVRVLTLEFNKAETDDCEEKWRPGVIRIRFSSRDTASRRYRIVRTCSFESNHGDKSVPAPKYKPGTLLPILAGAVVTLHCNHDWFKIIGDDTLTCTEDGYWEPTKQPTCTWGKFIFLNSLICAKKVVILKTLHIIF